MAERTPQHCSESGAGLPIECTWHGVSARRFELLPPGARLAGVIVETRRGAGLRRLRRSLHTEGVRAFGGVHLKVAQLNGETGPVSVGVRPEKIHINGSEENRIPGRVLESAYIGVATQYVVDTDVGRLMVFAQNTHGRTEAIGPGSSVNLTFSPESTFVLEATR